MKKIILTFGLISGVISSLMMILTVSTESKIGSNKALYLGYTGIVLSFLLVYFGVRSYRDNVGGGQITFSKAFVIGLSITLISCVFYVVVWEIMYFKFMPDFMDNYSAHVLAKLQASGASAAVVAQKTEEMKQYAAMYNNPFFNAAMTFIEPFPVGLVITLISAALLRKRAVTQAA
jgi:Protein of unknown function (DUF4199)